MEFNIDTFHPLVLNIGLARHNADLELEEREQPFRTSLLRHRRYGQSHITRPYRIASRRIYVFYPCIYTAQL